MHGGGIEGGTTYSRARRLVQQPVGDISPNGYDMYGTA